MIPENEINKKRLSSMSFIDLFAGIGGFHSALASFGAECVFVSEFDRFAANVYEQNYHIRPAGDITKIDEKTIPHHDILCAGFPCQPFSISGKQKGFDDTRGTLFFDITRILSFHKPAIVLLENVANFERHDNGKTLDVIKKTLADLDYTVFNQILNAGQFGIPQNRNRIYILGFHKSLNVNAFHFPEITKYCSLENILLQNVELNQYVIKRNDIELNTECPVADSFGNYPQKPIRIGKVGKGGQGERIYHPKGHAITLSAYGGGIGAKTGLYYINDKVRKLAPRECARLMGFPDSFIIDSNPHQAYKQFGNGVVIDILQYILNEVEEAI